MSRLPLIAASALALAVAAPASAFTGWGVSGTLRAQVVPTAATVTKGRQAKTCQAGTRDKTKVTLKVVGNAKNPAVVACEQPPRSSLVTPALTSSAASVLGGAG